MTSLPFNRPELIKPLALEKHTVIHVEDEEVYEIAIRHTLRERKVRYQRVSLLSEAASYIHDEHVIGFIVDLRLPPERSSDFVDWGSFPRTSTGFIEKIRAERPCLPLVVLSNFLEDSDLQRLLRMGMISLQDIFRKMDIIDDEVSGALVSRFCMPS